MTGRQLLDIAAIFKATRGVMQKHFAIQRHQLNLYGKTSSWVKAANKKVNKISHPRKDASAFSTERARDIENYLQTNRDKSTRSGTTVPTQPSISGKKISLKFRSGLEQDHHYERSENNTAAQAPTDSSLNVQQKEANRYPLPDGSIPPIGSDSGQFKTAQESFSSVSRAEPQKDPLESRGHGKVGFLQPASSSEPNLLTSKGYNKSVTSRNGEVSSAQSSSASLEVEFPAPLGKQDFSDGKSDLRQKKKSEQHVPEVQAIPEQGQPSEDMYSELFHSPRVARLLKATPKNDGRVESLDLQGVKDTPIEQSKLSQERDQASFNIRPTEQTDSKTTGDVAITKGRLLPKRVEDEDIGKIAEDLQHNAPAASPSVSQIPTELEGESKNFFKMHESRVPSSRFGRLWQYGGLATSMAFGAVGEGFRRATGSKENTGRSLILSAGNMNRIVAKLSKMRGAALKLGQMMSFQDSKALPAPIIEVLQRVQDSADYMPAAQRNQVLASNLGSEWRDLFSSFDEIPMAAASIGQVHGAVLRSLGQPVAVKVQYPGVADSIDSDLNNLGLLLAASKLLPKGLYLDKTIANARTELAWECDYIREAACGKRFQKLLQDDQDVFAVPSIVDSASGPQVLTMARMEGICVTKMQDLTQDQRDWIGTQILRLCLREITEFRFMQTDPNWTNFLFNARTQKIELLDFGASRDFPDKFIEPYIRILRAASRHDRDACCDLSITLGYLTGYESPAMFKAHIDSILTLAEPFWEHSSEVYDFRDQTITDRVRGLIPMMLRERLAPPPEETYSLHRKLSGAFLLCARLGSRIRCREMFEAAMARAGVA